MCQVESVSVVADLRGSARLIEVKLDTGEVVAFTFSVASLKAGPSGLFGRRVQLEPLAPSMYDEFLFGSASKNGGAS